jgi:hypothetical protein
VGPALGSAPREEIDEGGGVDITAEEHDAIAGPTGGAGGPTLTGMLAEWLFKDQAIELEKIQLEEIDQEIDSRLKGLSAVTIAFQFKGEIAYAQVTLHRMGGRVTEVGPPLVGINLEGVYVTDQFRQSHKSSTWDGVEGVINDFQTHSFPLHLHPAVLLVTASQLNNQIAAIEAKLDRSPTAPELQKRREQLRSCLHLLKTRGPHVASFSHLGGDCLDVLPAGRPPPT